MESLMSREELQRLAGQTLLAIKNTQDQMGVVVSEIKEISQSVQELKAINERTDVRLTYLEKKGPGGDEAIKMRNNAVRRAVYREIRRTMPEAFTPEGDWKPEWRAKKWHRTVLGQFFGKATSSIRKHCGVSHSKNNTSLEDAHNIEMLMATWEPEYSYNWQTGSIALAQYCREIINEKRR